MNLPPKPSNGRCDGPPYCHTCKEREGLGLPWKATSEEIDYAFGVLDSALSEPLTDDIYGAFVRLQDRMASVVTKAFLRYVAEETTVRASDARKYVLAQFSEDWIEFEAFLHGEIEALSMPVSYLLDPEGWREERERRTRELADAQARADDAQKRELERYERAQLRRLKKKYETTKEA